MYLFMIIPKGLLTTCCQVRNARVDLAQILRDRWGDPGCYAVQATGVGRRSGIRGAKGEQGLPGLNLCVVPGISTVATISWGFFSQLSGTGND